MIMNKEIIKDLFKMTKFGRVWRRFVIIRYKFPCYPKFCGQR